MAEDLGFDAAAVAPAGPAPHAAAFRDWIARGRQSGMDWMARVPERRADPRLWAPEARSLLIVGLGYAAAPPDAAAWNDPRRGRVARYAWGPDYHDLVKDRLRALAVALRRAEGWTAEPRAFVDTAPVLERDWAAAAGVGFAGRNAQLIHPRIGSYLWLGGLALPAAVDAPDPGPVAEDCPPGCARCLAACPGGALVAPHELDARRCLSWWTIEHRDLLPAGIVARLDRWIFGCDACQEACPWNGARARPGGAATPFDAERHAPRLEDVLAMSEADFCERYRGTPVWRACWSGFVRNAVAALAASAHPDRAGLLARVAREHPHPLVRAQAEQENR